MMKIDQWQRVKDLVAAALELDAAGREALLARECGTDAVLRKEVESLLRAYQEDFIETPALAPNVLLAPTVRPIPELPPLGRAAERRADSAARDGAAARENTAGSTASGKRVGAYRIESVIASGGMGTVYLGVRADDAYQRRVAIKLIRTSLFDDLGLAESQRSDLLKRFRAERQLLADLDHPNICRLLDGGTTEEGSPYLVMEYIQGRRIDEYCDAHNLSITERLKLFRQVCAAVQYAHQRLVIHRDLKPSNILVTEDDGRTGTAGTAHPAGVPKLVDFGIAKLLDPSARTGRALPTLVTQAEQRLMTPAYASPEQVGGQPVTTASDVYSLGVILYELLTGRRPHSVEGKLPQEVARLVLETEPERPSLAAAQDTPKVAGPEETMASFPTGTARALAALREGTPDKLRRRLQGDLDNIVLMALRKEPQRRYASVEQLSEDIRRHLESLPVQARSDTFTYRASRFVRRNRVGVVAAALILLALVSGIAGTTWQAIAADRERARKTLEAETNDLYKQFFEGLFLGADISENQALADSGVMFTSALDLLNSAAEKIRALDARPVIKARLLSRLGQALHLAGSDAKALACLTQALSIQRDQLGNRDPETLETMDELGMFYTDVRLYDRAEPLVLEALQGRRAVLKELDRKTIHSINNLGRVYKATNRLDEAGRLFAEALESAQRSSDLGPKHPDTFMIANNLAAFHEMAGDVDKAIAISRSVLEDSRGAVPDDHWSRVLAMSNLGTMLKKQRKLKEAEPLLEKALEVRRRTLPEGHPYTISAMFRVADLYRQTGREEEAVRLLCESIEAEMKQHADGDQYLVVHLNQPVLKRVLKPEDYDKLLRGVVEKYAQLSDAEAVQTLQTQASLADLLIRKKDFAAAETLLERALTTATSSFKPADAITITIQTSFGQLCTETERFDDAQAHLFAARDALEHPPPEADIRVIADRRLAVSSGLAKLYQAWKKPELAEPLLLQLVEAEMAEHSDGDPGLSAHLNQLLRVSRSLNHLPAFADLLTRIATEYAARPPKTSKKTLQAEASVAALLVGIDEGAKAESLLGHADAVASQEQEADPGVVAVRSAYAELYRKQQRFADAEQLLLKSHAALTESLGPQHARTVAAAGRLADLYEAWGKPEVAEKYRAKPQPGGGEKQDR